MKHAPTLSHEAMDNLPLDHHSPNPKSSSALSPLMAKLALLTVAVLWGSSLVVVKGATDFMPPNFLLGLRFSLAATLLALVFHRRLVVTDSDHLKRGAIIGLWLFAAYSCQTLGVTYAMPGRSAFLSASYCVIVPFLNWIVAGHRPDGFNIGAAVLCVTGVSFVSLGATTGESLLGGGISWGDGLALLSGLLFAAHIVAVGKWGAGRDPVVMTILQFGFAALFAWIASGSFEDSSSIVWSSKTVYDVAYLALFCTAVALLLQNVGQAKTDPSSAAIILGLESVFGILFSILFCGETMVWRLYVGFSLIFSAIIVSETKLTFLKNRHIVVSHRS